MKELKKRKRCLNKLRSSGTSSSRLCLSNISNSSYPFLTLLGEICLLVQNNNVKDSDECTNDINDNANHFKTTPLIDKALYPFSSLLQNFIHEANLHKLILSKRVDKDESLFCIERSISYPLNDSYSHQSDKENFDSFDYSYASRLKHMACQSEKRELGDSKIMDYENNNSNVSDIRNILQMAFPIKEKVSGDMIYSRKLQSFSENILREQKNAHLLYSTYQNFNEQTNDVDISDPVDVEEHSQCYMEAIAPVKCHNTNERANNDFTCTKSNVKDKHLFEALMNNVHVQSRINYNNNLESQNSTLIKMEPANDNLVDTEIRAIENILQRLHKNNWES